MSAVAVPVGEPPPMPKGIQNVYIFDFFNTAAWIPVLGTPMLVFMQHLGATATVLAIAASLSPLLVTLQIPAALYVERVGYRRFVLAGWSTRSFFLIGMAVVAFLPESIDRTTRIVLMLFMSLCYNVLRGISTVGLLPWFTHIVPEERRGGFLARDQSAIAVAAIISLLFYGLILRGDHAWYAFGVVYATASISAFISLVFLKRIPDVAVEKVISNPNPLPWREMLFYPPFLHYLRYNMVVNTALGASGVFWIRFFRTRLGISESDIILVAAGSAVVLAVALYLVTSVIDRAGNKPVLTLSGILYVIHFSGWTLVAAGIIPFNLPVLVVQQTTAGIAGALWNIGNVRAVMSIVPEMGRPHFLALYSVISSLVTGLVPLFWGPVMDGLEQWHVRWGFWTWTSYSVLYLSLALIMVAGLILLGALKEPMKMTWDVFAHELLIKTPSRAISRLLTRGRTPGNV